MNGRRPQQMTGNLQLPPLTPLSRNVLIALFVLYALELTARNLFGLPVDALAWNPFGQGFAVWQPATRYLVQGQGVLGVVFGGIAIYFFLPAVQGMVSRRQLLEALLTGWAGGTVLGLLLDGLGLAGGVANGWAPLITVLLVIFGLKVPDASILLFFILPIPARVIAWGTGLITLLFLLASFGLGPADAFGTWAGAVGWWYWRGPAGRRRRLLRDAARIESDLSKFTVLDGGRENRDDDDDWVH